MKKISLLLIIFSLSITIAHAQTKPAKDCPEYKKMKEELKQHFETKMYPNIKSEHDKLMTKVSEEDQAKLKKLSKAHKAAMKEKNAYNKAAKKAKNEGKEMKKWKHENRETRQKFMKKIRKINLELRPISKKYKSEIFASQDRLEPQNETWQEQRIAIRDKYNQFDCVKYTRQNQAKMPKKDAKLKPKKSKELQKKIQLGQGAKGKQAQQGAPKHPTARIRRAASFLLWDAAVKEMPNNLDSTDNYERKPVSTQN